MTDSQKTNFENWQQWGRRPDVSDTHHMDRLKGNLPEMESTKQLVKLISSVYEPGMRILDVGCNVGHYLTGIRKKYPKLDYVGVDAYKHYVDYAKNFFINDSHAKFLIKDIFKPIFPNDPFDVVFCCNVLLHLPDFRIPVKNLLSSTKKICFIRSLFGDKTTKVNTPVIDEYDEEGNPLESYFHNTWKKEYFADFVNKLGWKVEFLVDEFDTSKIQQEYENVKKHDKTYSGTAIINGKQVVDNIVLNYSWAKITSL